MTKLACALVVIGLVLPACGGATVLDGSAEPKGQATEDSSAPAVTRTCDGSSTLSYLYSYEARGAPSQEEALGGFLDSTFATKPAMPRPLPSSAVSGSGYRRVDNSRVVYRSDSGDVIVEFGTAETPSGGWVVSSATVCKVALAAGFAFHSVGS